MSFFSFLNIAPVVKKVENNIHDNEEKKLFDKYENNPVSVIIESLNNGNLEIIKKCIIAHPKVFSSNLKPQLYETVKSFFKRSLDNPEKEDIDMLHFFVNLGIFSIDDFRKDESIIKMVDDAIHKLQVKDPNIATRIKNLGFRKGDYSELYENINKAA